MRPKILIIYTGGTIGMKHDPKSGTLMPFNFLQITQEVPDLQKFDYQLDTLSFEPLVDSSDIMPDFWVQLAETVREHYHLYDGFVVLMGTDTMAYTASALSFMLEDLEKPVILTGSQLPIGILRTDGKENFISAVEIAAAKGPDGRPQVPEVSIFFESQLFRGNRTTKYNAEQFKAFLSPNYPPLAEAGIHIKYNHSFIRYPKSWNRPLKIHTHVCCDLAILKLFPGIQEKTVRGILSIPGLRAIILETYGSGNAPTLSWLIRALQQAIEKGILVYNVSQCYAGSVAMETYATGIRLKEVGVLSGHDITTEAAVAKMILLTGQFSDNKIITEMINQNLRGEITI
ncbi:MAG: type I asparaginase [Bacteroidetes bacterium]|nr:type I asparaginase [Bacteroidota bacterium]